MGENTRDLAVRAEQRTRGLAPTDTTWRTPTLINSWANFGGAYAPASYRKDGAGFVHLRGLVKTGLAGSTVFVLPVGFRVDASGQELFVTIANGVVASIEVLPAGDVYSSAAGTSYVSLAGITFYAGT